MAVRCALASQIAPDSSSATAAGANYALAPFQPEWVMSKMMPSGSWYFFS